jgi:hypothetical protein
MERSAHQRPALAGAASITVIPSALASTRHAASISLQAGACNRATKSCLITRGAFAQTRSLLASAECSARRAAGRLARGELRQI